VYSRRAEAKSVLWKQFGDAIEKSIGVHCAGVVEQVPSEEIDALSEEDVILIMSAYVLADVMALGLRIMSWRHVTKTVDEAVAGVIAEQRRRMNGEVEGEEKASTL